MRRTVPCKRPRCVRHVLHSTAQFRNARRHQPVHTERRGHSPGRCIVQMQIVLMKSDRFDELNAMGINHEEECEL